MNPSLDEVIQELYLLQPLLKAVDEEVFNFIKESGVEPFFAVSWALTWYNSFGNCFFVFTRTILIDWGMFLGFHTI